MTLASARRSPDRRALARPGADEPPSAADAHAPPRRSGEPGRARRDVAVPAPPARRTREPGTDWAEAEVPGCWTMQGFDDLPHYTNVQMPFPGFPPDIPDDNPTGVYEREIEAAGRLGGAADRAPRRRRRERPDRLDRRRATSGISKDSHLAAEFDVTDARRGARPAPADAAGREVVRRDVHRGPGPVVARRDHPLRVPLRDGAGLPRRRPGDRRAGRRPHDGHARPAGRGRLRRGGDPGQGWTGRGPVAGPRAPLTRARPRPPARGRHEFDGARRRDLLDRHDPRRAADGRRAEPRPGRRSTLVRAAAQGGVVSAGRRPGVDTVVRGAARVSTRSRSCSATRPARSPTRRELRVGFRRVEIVGVDLLVNGRRVLIHGVNRHDFDQHTGRVIVARDDAGRPRPDEAVQLQRRPDLALPERPGASST